MTALLFAIFATYGWALVLTKGRGPFGVLSRARATQRASGVKGQTLITCQMCMGFWIGLFFAGLHGAALALDAPRFDLAAYLLAAPGAAAGVAWLGFHVAERQRHAGEHAAEQTYGARLDNQRRESLAAEVRKEEQQRAAFLAAVTCSKCGASWANYSPLPSHCYTCNQALSPETKTEPRQKGPPS